MQNQQRPAICRAFAVGSGKILHIQRFRKGRFLGLSEVSIVKRQFARGRFDLLEL